MEPTSDLSEASATIGIDLEGLRKKYKAQTSSASSAGIDTQKEVFDALHQKQREKKIKYANDVLDQYRTCHMCHGTGIMKSIYNFMTMESNCEHCDGEGVMKKEKGPSSSAEAEQEKVEEVAEEEVEAKEEADSIKKLLVLCGGNLASDVGEQIVSKASGEDIEITQQGMWEVKAKTLSDGSVASDTLVVFVVETVENEAPPEEASSMVMFFKRKSHPADLLTNKFKYCVLGLGNSDLLLDRQTTTAKDCNQAAQMLDKRLEALGGIRHYELGMADERADLVEVEPWIEGLVKSLSNNDVE